MMMSKSKSTLGGLMCRINKETILKKAMKCKQVQEDNKKLRKLIK